MASSPVVEWRSSSSPYGVITSLALTGSGYSGSIPAGVASNVVTLRLYNNFASASGITDALNCALAAYDDPVHQGQSTQVSTQQGYVQVLVVNYNGNPTGADTVFYGIGGQTKHPLPVNGGTIGGTSINYVTIQVRIQVPSNATQGAVSQGLWVEYSATA